jgi:hypothetical protein
VTLVIAVSVISRYNNGNSHKELGMAVIIRQQRAYPRIKLNWPIEYRARVGEEDWIHEGSKLEDYSLSGACFLAMLDLKVGMEIMVSIKFPTDEQRIDLHGEIVRVDERVDVGNMFKAIGIRWALEVFNKLLVDSQNPLNELLTPPKH